MGARRRARDEFQRMDPSLSGVLLAEDFVAVLTKMFMIEMSETDWASFAQKHAGSIVLRDGTVNYKQFLDTVLDPKMDQGLYTPKAVGRVVRWWEARHGRERHDRWARFLS